MNGYAPIVFGVVLAVSCVMFARADDPTAAQAAFLNNWMWENEEPSAWSFSSRDNTLQIVPAKSILFDRTPEGIRNVLAHKLPDDGTCTVEVVLHDFDAARDGNRIYLMFYNDEDNFAAIRLGKEDGGLLLMQKKDHGYPMQYGWRAEAIRGSVALRIRRSSLHYTGYYMYSGFFSGDSGEHWQKMGDDLIVKQSFGKAAFYSEVQSDAMPSDDVSAAAPVPVVLQSLNVYGSEVKTPVSDPPKAPAQKTEASSDNQDRPTVNTWRVAETAEPEKTYELTGDELRISVNGGDGTITELLGSLPGRKEVRFSNDQPMEDPSWRWGMPLFYGEDEKRILPLDQRVLQSEKGDIESCYAYPGFDVVVTRTLEAHTMRESYALRAKKDITLSEYAIVFRPNLTMHVGEEAPFVKTDSTPVSYHWFTGGALSWLSVNHNNGLPPNLAIAVEKGALNGYDVLYSYGSRRKMPLPASPVLYVTGYRSHKEQDEYPQVPLQLKAGDVHETVLRYFLYEDTADLKSGMCDLARQPVLDYPLHTPVDKPFEVKARLPRSVRRFEITQSGKPVETIAIDDRTVRFTVAPEKPGLGKVQVGYTLDDEQANREGFFLYTAMRDWRPIIEAKARFIMDSHYESDANDPGFGGFFSVDLKTGRLVKDANAYSCQLCGIGEVEYMSVVPAFVNAIAPRDEDIAKLETYLNTWRRKCQDEQGKYYLNPLNHLLQPERDGLGRRGSAYSFFLPQYYLSWVDASMLRTRSPKEYLEEIGFGYMQFPEILDRQTEVLGEEHGAVTKRLLDEDLQSSIESSSGLYHCVRENQDEVIVDPNCVYGQFYQNIFLKRKPQADFYRDFYAADSGFSYDPRGLAAFRIWDDYASMYYYQLIPYPTMPNFNSALNGFNLLAYYEQFGGTENLRLAYDLIMTYYDLHDYDYAHNDWGRLEPGQSHACWLPGLAMSTQERFSSDEDFAFIYFIQSFGKKCYVDSTGMAVNGERNGNVMVSWAPYPREYHNDLDGYVITSSHLAAIIEKVTTTSDGYEITLRNLNGNVAAKTTLRCETAGGSSCVKRVNLEAGGCRAVKLPNPQGKDNCTDLGIE